MTWPQCSRRIVRGGWYVGEVTSTPSGSDAPTPDDGPAEEVPAASKKPVSSRPSTPRTPRSTTARPAAARKPAAKKSAATSSASAAAKTGEGEAAAPAAPKKPATTAAKRPAAKRTTGAAADETTASAPPAAAKKPVTAKKPAAPRKPAARTTAARTGDTSSTPRTTSARTKAAQTAAKTSPRTPAAKTPPPVPPLEAPVPVDFVIPPKPPLPPRPVSTEDEPTPVDEDAIVPAEAPVEAASPTALDEVPVVMATDRVADRAVDESTPETEQEPTSEGEASAGETEATADEPVIIVEVAEEPFESADASEADDAPPVDAAAEAPDVAVPSEVADEEHDTVVLTETAVVTERAADEAERLFAEVAENRGADDVPALALEVSGLAKSYGSTVAVAGIDLVVPAGTFYGLVGPNGAGKTTTLSMIAGLLKPDAGTIRVAGVDARTHARQAKRLIGVLPDRLRTFDRLTGRQLLSYAGLLRGLDANTVERRASDLGRAFDLTSALGRSVSDYSAGMTKKIMLAAALIHSPRLLVLDEPFEAVDPVSSSVILDILGTYVSHGGTVLLSSHGMDLVERVCDRVAVIVSGQVLADGTVSEVRGEQTLEARFLELVGGSNEVEGLEWLHTFSD